MIDQFLSESFRLFLICALWFVGGVIFCRALGGIARLGENGDDND